MFTSYTCGIIKKLLRDKNIENKFVLYFSFCATPQKLKLNLKDPYLYWPT